MGYVSTVSRFCSTPSQRSLRSHGRIACIVVACAAGAGLSGCRHNSDSAAAPAVANSTAHSYTIRGIIEKLPTAGARQRLLTVHMETIKKFYQPGGKAVKMDAMTMPFPLAKGVSAAGLKRHEKIEMTLVVDWSKNINHVTSVKALPSSTHLHF